MSHTTHWSYRAASLFLAVLFVIQPLATPRAEASSGSSADAGSEARGVSAGKSINNDHVLVSPVDGSLSFTYPITIPPGRNGMQPNIDLKYNSSFSDSEWLGAGWSINIPYIKRFNKTGTENLYGTSSVFYSSLSGELAPTATSTIFQSRVETGDFLKYEQIGSTWVATDKQGTRYTFGSTTNEHLASASTTGQIYQWFLSEIRDTNGNSVLYIYEKIGGMVYPYSILYTVFGGLSWNSVSFSREVRPDPIRSYASRFPVDITYRINAISTFANGSKVREYNIAYQNGNNGKRSILKSITETGLDGANTITLPADTFSYSTSTNIWEEAASSSIPEPFVKSDNTPAGTYLVDINGDALPDIVRSYAEGASSTQRVHINKGGYWNYDASWIVPTIFQTSTSSKGAQFVDVNGDAFPDIVQSFKESNGVETRKVWLSTTTGWSYNASWTIPELFQEGTTDYGARMADVNGDGLVDILIKRTNTAGTILVDKVYLNTGSGWAHAPSWSIPQPFIYSDTADAGTRLADLNNDGLVDIVTHRVDSNYAVQVNAAYLNTGSGWVENSSWRVPLPLVYYGAYDYGGRFVDVNNDGLVDYIFKHLDQNQGIVSGTYLNNGAGWSTAPHWYLPVPITINWTDDLGTRFADVDGNGMVDVIVRTDYVSTTGASVNATTNIYHGTGAVVDMLTVHEDRRGGSTSFGYRGSTTFKTPTNQNANPLMPMSMQTVATTTYNSGFGTTWKETYNYADGTIYASSTSPRDRKFAGFGKITRVADDSVVTSYQHQGNTNSTSSSEVGDVFAKLGYTYRVDTADTAGNLYSVARTNWGVAALAPSSWYVRKINDVSLQYDGNSDHKDSAVTYEYQPTTGNVVTISELGEVTAALGGTYTDVAGDTRTTRLTYATNTSAYIIGLPSTKIVQNNAGTKITEQRYYYDAQTLGNVTKGNATKIEDWVSGSTYVSSQSAYNSYGLKTSDTNPRGFTTLYGYDAQNQYVASTTNPLGHSTQYTYDYSSGKPLVVTDPNGFTHERAYDPLDRVTIMLEPRYTNDTLANVEELTYTDTKGANSVKQSKISDGDTIRDTYTYLDGFGRTIQTRDEVDRYSSTRFAVTDIVWGGRGLVHKESLPYFDDTVSASFTGRTQPIQNAALYTTYWYDPLNRVTQSVNAVGATQNTYDQWKVTTVDPGNRQKAQRYDALGRLAAVEEKLGTSTLTTNYVWTAHNQLATSTDALSNVRAFTYDGLGRRLSAQDLHAPADTTFSTWTYAYDAASNLATTTDPKGQVVVRTYDALNRQLTENFTGQTGTEFTFAYDSCTKGKGQLCSVSSATSTTAYKYFASGMPHVVSKTIGGTTYHTTTTYDGQLSPQEITHPNGAMTYYQKGGAGGVNDVFTKDPGDVDYRWIASFSYSPLRQVQDEWRSNSTETETSYDENELYRVKRIHTYFYGTGGNPELTAEEENAVSEPFTPLFAAVSDALAPFVDSWTGSSTEVADTSSTSSVETTLIEEIPESITVPAPLLESASSTEVAPLPREVASTTRLISPEENLLGVPKDEKKMEPVITTIGTTPDGASIKQARIFQDGAVEDTVVMEQAEEGKRITKGGTVLLTDIRNDAPLFTLVGIGGQALRMYAKDEKKGEGNGRTARTKADGTVTYKNIMPDGADIELVPFSHGVRKNVVFGQSPLTGTEGETYDVSFTLETSGATDIRIEGALVSENGSITSSKTAEVLVNGVVASYILPPIAESDQKFSLPDAWKALEATYTTETDGSITVTKHIPTAWLKDAVYPVRADFFMSLRPGYGDGVIISLPYPGSWSAQHDATQSAQLNSVAYLSNVLTGSYVTSGGYLTISRDFFSFDTSALPDNALIATATLKVWPTEKFDGINDSASYIAVYEGLQNSPNELVAEDYDRCGNAITNPTVGSELKDVTGITVGQHNNIALNATGTNWISKTGWTKLCIRTGHDAENLVVNNETNVWKQIGISHYTVEQNGSDKDPYLEITYTDPAAVPPTAPTSPNIYWSSWPYIQATFNAVFNDPYAGDAATAYEVQVSTSSTATTSPLWQSAKTQFSVPVPVGTTTPWIDYTGPTLANNTAYYWRIRLYDTTDTVSPWSTGLQFSAADNFNLYPARQDLVYKYDASGNITAISDVSVTTSPKTTVYAYDTLSRLTSVGTTSGTVSYSGYLPIVTFSNPTPYRTYTLNALGNLTNASHIGSYVYAGTARANPHAPTTVGGVTQTYDNNGNLLTGAGYTNTWNYRNELWKVASGTASTTYSYDVGGTRILKQNATSTTRYISPEYEVTGSTTIRHIYANGSLIASVERSGAVSIDSYILKDHLGSTHIVANKQGNAVQTLEYHPYGEVQSYKSVTEILFQDTLNPTYTASSWNVSANTASTPVYQGTSSLRVSYSAPWGGMAYTKYQDTSPYTTLSLSLNIGTSSTPDLYLYFTNASGTPLGIKNLSSYIPGGIQPNTWHTLTIPLQDLNVQNYVGTLTLNLESSLAVPLYLDSIGFGGTKQEPNQYIGQDFDPESQMSYLNARYYEGSRGQFLSQDPVFLDMGLDTLETFAVMRNPQLANSYSYAGDNPIKDKDPNGRIIDTLVDFGFIAYDVYRVGDAYLNGGNVQEELGYLGLDVAGAAVPFATGFGAIARTAKIASKAEKAYEEGRAVEAGIKIGEAGGPGAGKRFPKSVQDTARQQSQGKCVFCGVDTQQGVRGPTQSQTDHAIPKSKGGNNSQSNAQNTCRSCNLSKGSNTSVEHVQKQLIKVLKAYVKKLGG